ncbi:MAG TPA: hypothetical protein VE088_08760 [Gaiellaceae bacterium]|nr:hypothetical protein [Gaiellaceae bacterium]
MTAIETERLLLRLPQLADAAALPGLHCDPVAMEFIGGVHPDCGEGEWPVRLWLDVDRLVSVIAPANVGSQRLAERLGCTRGETVELADTGPAVVWEHPR